MNWIIVSKLLCIIMCYVLIVILDNTVGMFACVLNELSLIFITNIVNEVAFVQLKWQGKK